MTTEITTQTTSDINLATFIKVVKKVPMARYHFNQQQLCIVFDLDEETLRKYQEEYLNSTYAEYDAAKRNFMQLLRHR